MRNDKQYCQKTERCCRCFSAISKFIFALGTLLLGIAVCFKLPEINSAVEHIKNLNNTVESLKRVENQNNQMLSLTNTELGEVIKKASSDEPNNESKQVLYNVFQGLSSMRVSNISIDQKNFL